MGLLAVAGAGLGIAGQIMSYNAQVRQAQTQATQAIKSMNKELMNLEITRQDSFDAAVQEITKTRLNSMGLIGSVDAAVNEEMTGRTARLIQRSVRGDEARAVSSIQENYDRKSNEIDLNKETSLKSTQDYISNIQLPSRDALFLGIVGSAVQAFTGIQGMKADALSKGMDWDFWKGAVPRAAVPITKA